MKWPSFDQAVPQPKSLRDLLSFLAHIEEEEVGLRGRLAYLSEDELVGMINRWRKGAR